MEMPHIGDDVIEKYLKELGSVELSRMKSRLGFKTDQMDLMAAVPQLREAHQIHKACDPQAAFMAGMATMYRCLQIALAAETTTARL
jgi:hypothetical protein